MNAVSIVKSALLKRGNQALGDIVCPCCREAAGEALKICEKLNTPEDYHKLLMARSRFQSTLTLSEDRCPAYMVTTHEIALVYERLRVLWKMGPVSWQAMRDVSYIIDGVVSRN